MMNLHKRREYIESKTIKKGKLQHERDLIPPLLPFTTRNPERVDFNQGMTPIIGALSRIVCNKDVSSINTIDVHDLTHNDEYFDMGSDCEHVFEALLSEYTGNHNLETIIHPKLLLFLPLTDSRSERDIKNNRAVKGEAVGEIKAAEFLNQIFFKNIDFRKFFEEESFEDSNVLIKFIVENLSDVGDERENNTEYVMSDTLNKVIEVFTEDFNFLLNHKEYLMNNLDLILAFYYFFYLVQFTLKINSNGVSNDIEELYWLLDSESMSKNRVAISRGYKSVDNALRFLLANINLVIHTNFLLGTDNLFPAEVIEYINNCEREDKRRRFLSVYSEWIDKWRYLKNLETVNVSKMSINELVPLFRDTFTETLDAAPQSRFKEAVKSLGTNYFLKRRGRYGYMLNLTQELLIVITAICIKNGDKLSLNDLFLEYERRGIFLDRNSRDEVVEIFNRLNLIDKKSDSGEVEYVKSIL